MKAACGVDIKLRVAGKSLKEYEGTPENRTAEDSTTLTRYVEVVSGSTFALRITVPPCMAREPEDGITFQVYLDGKYATGRFMDGSKFASSKAIMLVEGIDAMTPRGRELERFAFAPLVTKDTPITADMELKHLKELGSIAIRCIWARPASESINVITDSFRSAVSSSIPEKCLKGRAISNQASVAKAESLPGSISSVHTTSPYGNQPFAIFEYRYRSRRDLQVEGIIENDAEPVALADRDPATLTAEEVGQLQKQLQARQEEITRIKQEKRAWVHADDDDSDDVEVVSGDNPFRKKRKSIDSGSELIDLTAA